MIQSKLTCRLCGDTFSAKCTIKVKELLTLKIDKKNTKDIMINNFGVRMTSPGFIQFIQKQ